MTGPRNRDSALARVMSEEEVSRKLFLKGGGALVRFKQAPSVTTVVLQRLDLPSSGSGEPTTAAVPAAIANAFFDATGVRLYRMPMTPAYVRGALAA